MRLRAQVSGKNINLYIGHAADRHTKTNTYLVLRDTYMTAILVEAGFITNEQEENKLNSDTYQNIIADSIFSGVMDYYGMKKEDINKDGVTDIMDLASMAKNMLTSTTLLNITKS